MFIVTAFLTSFAIQRFHCSWVRPETKLSMSTPAGGRITVMLNPAFPYGRSIP